MNSVLSPLQLEAEPLARDRLDGIVWPCPLQQAGSDGGTADRCNPPLQTFHGAGGQDKGDDRNGQRKRRKEGNLDNQEGGVF